MTREEWENDGKEFGWRAPAPSAKWKRLPVIRHIRAFWLKVQIERPYSTGLGSVIGFRTGYDDWALYGIWKGWI